MLGAAGGIGLAVVELGRAAGARIIAAVSTPEKLELAMACGAASGFVYPTGAQANEPKGLAQLFKQHCGPDRIDVVCDPFGDVYSEPALRCIAWGGRYLVIGFPAGAIPLNLPLLKGCDIRGVLFGSRAQRNPAEVQKETGELFALYEGGAIRPHISARSSFAHGGRAIAEVAARRALGKLVVVMDNL